MDRVRKIVVLVFLGVVSVVNASDFETYLGGAESWFSCNTNSCMTQEFLVPLDHDLTEIKFYLHDNKNIIHSEYKVNFALYSGSYGSQNLVKVISIPQSEIDYTGWIKMSPDSLLPSGKYYMQVWSNNPSYNAQLFGRLNSGSTYLNGRAATGWSGGSLLGSEQDFKAGFTAVRKPLAFLTAQGGTEMWYSCNTNSCITQDFSVPLGHELTKVEFYLQDNKYIVNPGYSVAIALYSGAYGTQNLIKVISIPQSEIDFAGWISMDLEYPSPAGEYYIQVWSNNSTYNSQLFGKLYTGSSCLGGRASTGWAGVSLLAEDQDFLARFTIHNVLGGVVKAYTESCSTAWYQCSGSGGYIGQSFSVLPGHELNSVEFFISDGDHKNPGYAVNMSLYKGDCLSGEYIKTVTVYSTEWQGANFSLKMDLDTPKTDGDYYVKVWSNHPIYNDYLHGYAYSNSNYSYGYAFTYNSGGLPIAAGIDFKAQYTTSKYRIVLPMDAIESEQCAAQELQYYIKEMSGVELSIVMEDEYETGAMIAVGFNDKLPQELSEAAFGELGDEEVIIKSSDDILLLAGGRPRGALYAVYEFLHKHGVRWYTPTYTKIPTVSYYDIDFKNQDCRHNPPMRSRSQLVGNAPTQEWTAANRINTMKLWSALDQEYGGGHGQGPDMHTFHQMISVEVLEQHPEWLAEVNGQRELPVGSTWGLCLSNQAVRQYLIDETIEWAKQHPDKDSIWIGQNDGSDYCTCSQCQSFYDSHGGEPSSLIVQLANELAGLLSLEMPDKVVKTLAYHWSLMPPDGMQVRDDVIVVFCAQGDFFQPIATDPDRTDLRAALASWKNICNNFEVYLYSTPWENYWFSSPSMYSGAENIKWASQNGITNVYTQISGFGDTYGSEFMDLRAWVYARLAWDPTMGIQSLIDDFVYGYYGPAAESVLNAISLTHSNVFDANGDMISYNNSDVVPNYINPATVRTVNQNFASLYSTISDETYKDHLELAWLPYLWTDFWLGYSGPGVYNDVTSMWKVPISDYATRCQYPSKIKQYMIEHGVNVIGENKPLNPYYLSLDKMGVDFPADHFENGNIEAVVVPAVAGQIFDYKDTTLNFSPLKHYWGFKMCEYPLYSSWRDFVNSAYSKTYSVKESSLNSIVLKTQIGDFLVEKTVAMLNGELSTKLTACAVKDNSPVQLRICPMFDLSENVFGTYPTLHVEKSDGSWSEKVMGSETDFWYIAGKVDLTDATGRVVLACQNRPEGVLMIFDPSEVVDISFEYDVYDWPVDQGRKLHLSPISIQKTLQKDETIEMDFSLNILPDASLFVNGIVVNTYDSNSSQLSWWSVYGNGAPAVQHFVVPAGHICTKVEVLVEKGATTNSSYDAQLQVYDSSNNYLGGGSLSADQFASSSDWVAVDGLSLSAGSYYVQIFTNDSGFKGYMHTQFDASNAYTEGYGATGWNGGTEVAPVGDFAVRLKLFASP